MSPRAWRVDDPLCYVLETDESFNGPAGLVTVADLIAHPETWAALGVSEVSWLNDPFDARTHQSIMTFDGLTGLYVAQELSVASVLANVADHPKFGPAVEPRALACSTVAELAEILAELDAEEG
jgi:hypothetical protein